MASVSDVAAARILAVLSDPLAIWLTRVLETKRMPGEIGLEEIPPGLRSRSSDIQACFHELHRVGVLNRYESLRDGRPVQEYQTDLGQLFMLRCWLATFGEVEPAQGPGLHVLLGPNQGAHYPLPDADSWRLGRSDVCDWVTNDPSISMQHCIFERKGSKVSISKWSNTREGVLRNGDPVDERRPHALQDRDLLQIGRSLFMWLE